LAVTDFVPTTVFQVAAVIVFLLPGLVYAVVRRARKGFRPDDLALDSRIAQALVISVLLDATYVTVAAGVSLVWNWSLFDTMFRLTADGVEVVGIGWVALTVIACCGLIPAALAFFIHLPYRARWKHSGEKGFPLKFDRTIRYSDVPTAWDRATSDPAYRMIRVLFPDGRWVGGFYGPGSYVSTFPQPRDLFISHQYFMTKRGQFRGPMPLTNGVWLRISDDHVVEFLEPSYTAAEQAAVDAKEK
jgi:hypothetical protein